MKTAKRLLAFALAGVMALAESMKDSQGIEIALLAPGIPTLQAIAFTMTGKKSDGHRYYLALRTNATIKTPRT